MVLLKKCDYISKMKNILQDASKFTKLLYSDLYKLTTKVEDKVIRFINNLVSLNVITPDVAQSLKPTGSTPGIMYGLLPKVHKDSVPLRPIVAAYNTASYKLAKFLVPLLSKFTTNQFTVKNSYDLSKFLSDYNVPTLISYGKL